MTTGEPDQATIIQVSLMQVFRREHVTTGRPHEAHPKQKTHKCPASAATHTNGKVAVNPEHVRIERRQVARPSLGLGHVPTNTNTNAVCSD